MPVKPVAVIISTYNQPDFLRLTLEGYRQQDDLNFSVHIADDGSDETTAMLIQELQTDFPVPIHHHWQPDAGFRKARIHNRVIAEIEEPFVLLTDGDCIPLPGLIAAHHRFAHVDHFTSGSRILLSKSYTETLCRQARLNTAHTFAWWLMRRIHGDINRLLPLIMPRALSSPSTKLEGIRGCHLLCPTEALHRINGFDESFEGWGREDSDLTARLLHAGLKRRNLRGEPVLHLWHHESSRERLAANDGMLQQCIDEQRIRAICGIAEHTGSKRSES